MTAKPDQGEAVLDGFANGLDTLAEAYTDMDASAVAARIGTSYYRRAIQTQGTILMQPAALVRGPADSLPGNQVQLFENTPVTQISYGDRIIAQTPCGTIRRPKPSSW